MTIGARKHDTLSLRYPSCLALCAQESCSQHHKTCTMFVHHFAPGAQCYVDGAQCCTVFSRNFTTMGSGGSMVSKAQLELKGILHTAGQPPELPPKGGGMWPYPWTHVGTPSHLGHMDRVAATMPSQAHAGAAQEAPDIGQWEGQDVPLVRPSSCIVKGGIPSSRRYLPTYLCCWCTMLYRWWILMQRLVVPKCLTVCCVPLSLLLCTRLRCLQGALRCVTKGIRG